MVATVARKRSIDSYVISHRADAGCRLRTFGLRLDDALPFLDSAVDPLDRRSFLYAVESTSSILRESDRFRRRIGRNFTEERTESREGTPKSRRPTNRLSLYLHNRFKQRSAEHFLAMFFSEQGALVGELFLTSDNLGRVVVSPNAILRQAEHLRSTKIVLAHNHPSGLALPSKSDVRSTKYLVEYASLRGVQIEEHFIFSYHSIYSMRRARIIS